MEEDLQTQIDQLKRRIDATEAKIQSQPVSYVPSGVNFKLASPNSLNPGHLHDADGLDMVATNVFGYDITKVASIPVAVRNSSNFTKTTNITLADITGFSATLVSGGIYKFNAKLLISADVTGGMKVTVSGTVTPSILRWGLVVVEDGAVVTTVTSSENLNSDFSDAGATFYIVSIDGSISVTTGGTLTIQFAQTVSNGSSSVLTGSYFEVTRIS